MTSESKVVVLAGQINKVELGSSCFLETELRVGQRIKGSAYSLGKIDGKREYQCRLKTHLVLPYAAAEIIPAQEPSRPHLGVHPDQINGDSLQGMIRVHISQIQFTVRYLVNDLGCLSAQDYSLAGSEVGLRFCFLKELLEESSS